MTPVVVVVGVKKGHVQSSFRPSQAQLRFGCCFVLLLLELELFCVPVVVLSSSSFQRSHRHMPVLARVVSMPCHSPQKQRHSNNQKSRTVLGCFFCRRRRPN